MFKNLDFLQTFLKQLLKKKNYLRQKKNEIISVLDRLLSQTSCIIWIAINWLNWTTESRQSDFFN